MLKKLTQEQHDELLETGIREFARLGPDKTSIGGIAKSAGLSVGVLYKYYENKEDFFTACIRRCLGVLSDAVRGAAESGGTMAERAEQLIREVQRSAKTHSSYHALYQEITSGRCSKYAPVLAGEIERISAETYAAFIGAAQRDGEVRGDIDPKLLAFFFDNLLMMLQFSYCCDYYRERLKIYCGEDALLDDDKMAAAMLAFLTGAFGNK